MYQTTKKEKIVITLAVIIATALYVFVIPSLVFNYFLIKGPIAIHENGLKNAAVQNQKYTNGLVFFTSKHETVQAVPNEDSAGHGSTASVTYMVSGTQKALEEELSSNLAPKGYVFSHKYEAIGMDDASSTDNTHVNELLTTASKGSDIIQFLFVLSKDYQCPPGDGSEPCSKDVVQEAGLTNYPVSSVNITRDTDATAAYFE